MRRLAICLALATQLAGCATPEGRRTALTVCGIVGVALGGGAMVGGTAWAGARSTEPLELGLARDFTVPVAIAGAGVVTAGVGAALLDLAAK